MSSIDEYLWPNRLLCNVLGMWPINEDTASVSEKGFAHLRKLVTITAALGNIIIPEILLIMDSRDDVAVVTRVGCILITIILLLYKMLYLVYHGSELASLFFEIRDFWKIMEKPEEREVYAKFATIAKIFTIVFTLSGLGNNVAFTTAAMVDWIQKTHFNVPGIKRLPFEVRYGFDIQSSPNYEITFAFQTVSALLCTIGVVGLDSLMMTLIVHVCGQFSVVQFWYRDISSRITKYHNSNTIDKRSLRRELRRCLRQHQMTIRVADQAEDLFSPLIFAQFVLSGTEICLSGFAVTTGIDQKMDLIKFTNYLVSMTLELFAWCMVGEMLIKESTGVGDAIFHDVSWYNFPITLQRDLCLVILRSQKYCCITAAKFATINVEKLSQVFSSAASYYALLRQMK